MSDEYTSLASLISLDLKRLDSGVWVPNEQRTIAYSDGADSEAYLRKAMNQCTDLSSGSIELESYAKDWVSEYHLTRKRSQLFSTLEVDSKRVVVEVGCGCGAITRYLGEHFDRVISIEGSLARAELARLRTRDLPNVSVICAPYQDIKFKTKVGAVFCIGVLEYAGAFVSGSDPYRQVIREFAELLDENGQLVVAIENQFGLKYFTSAREDHTNRMFEGIEGYPIWGGQVKTFGYGELKSILECHFSDVAFSFPYPDYKIPTGVFSERMFDLIDAGELVGQYRGRDYAKKRKPLFDERLCTIELSKNKQLPFFANSFLVVASKSSIKSIRSAVLGVKFSHDRRPAFSTITRFIEDNNSLVIVDKQLLYGNLSSESESPIRIREQRQPWIAGTSLQLTIEHRLRDTSLDLKAIFEPCSLWLDSLIREGFDPSTHNMPAHLIDAIWRNTIVVDNEAYFFDLEWELSRTFRLETLVIRSILFFLKDLPRPLRRNRNLRQASTKKLVILISKAFGVSLDDQHFEAFIDIESEIIHRVSGNSKIQAEKAIRLNLFSEHLYEAVDSVRQSKDDLEIIQGRIRRGLRRMLS